MSNRLSIPGLISLAIGLFSFYAEMQYALLETRLGAVGFGRLGQFLAYALGFLGTYVGIQQLLTKGLAHGKQATLIRSRVFFPIEGRVYLGMMSVLFIGSIVGKSNPLLLVFCLMATPWIFNGFVAYTQLRQVDVKRRMPERGEAGQVIPITVTLSNRRRFLSVWMFTVVDQIDGPVGSGPKMKRPLKPEVAFLRVPRQQSLRRVYRVRLPRRGRYEFGPMQANTRYPLGLIERGLVIPSSAELLVYPRIGTLTAQWRRRSSRAQEQVTQAQSRAGSFEDDFHRVREYQIGDDPRSIHWPTTARRGSLIVREFHESRDRPLAVLVDLWSSDGKTNDRIELALDFAATIATDHARTSQRSSVHCSLGGSELTSWSSASRSDLGGLLDRMATIEPTTDDRTDELVTSWRSVARSDERVVWITTRDQNPVSSDLPADLEVIVVDPSAISELCQWGGDESPSQ